MILNIDLLLCISVIIGLMMIRGITPPANVFFDTISVMSSQAHETAVELKSYFLNL